MISQQGTSQERRDLRPVNARGMVDQSRIIGFQADPQQGKALLPVTGFLQAENQAVCI